MPRGDGTGPSGHGPLGRGRSCRQSSGLGNRMGRGLNSNCGAYEGTQTLEEQAKRLESQAAKLRNIAKENNV
ncbi:hypothetical protein [Dendrosporobacter sp. 1207_IL3150]|uniref:hypothetical protein n=1 Tax=Dendrosporobacter sp. 1207_IL3150 TaxID=3084054 RepID=UPI002FDABA8E